MAEEDVDPQHQINADRDDRLIREVAAGRMPWAHPQDVITALCRRYVAMQDDKR